MSKPKYPPFPLLKWRQENFGAHSYQLWDDRGYICCVERARPKEFLLIESVPEMFSIIEETANNPDTPEPVRAKAKAFVERFKPSAPGKSLYDAIVSRLPAFLR